VIRTRDLRRLARGLRFRLTATYAIFFIVPMIGVTGLLRHGIATGLDDQAHAVLDQEWAAMKGYLRIEPPDKGMPNEAVWYYDPLDSEESRIVLNIKRIYLVTDREGQAIPAFETQAPAISPSFREIGLEPAAEIREKVSRAAAVLRANTEPMPFWTVRRNAQGDQFLVRSGIVWDEEHLLGPGHGHPYYVAIGLPLRPYNNTLRQVTWLCVGVVPGALILGSFLGWIAAGRALAPVRSVAMAAQRISGSNLSLRIPVRDAGDELDYLIRTFNRMIERLESSFGQMKQFSTDVSHELRTPITAIRGQLEVALFTAQTTEQYREAMFNALQDIDRLSQIVRALLLLSQAESGQLTLQKSHLDLCEVSRDMVEQYQIPAEAAGVRLTADLPADCFLEADRVQIERLITNLLSNAIKFTPEGGEVKLTVRAPGEPAAQVELVVQDTGHGIATEHLKHIFDRFYRVPGPSGGAPEQGLGLGLSFVAWIVKAHGGKIQVESSVGHGTCFTIRLPAPGAGSGTVELAGQPAAS
jgi:heavy metal sensor kinase